MSGARRGHSQALYGAVKNILLREWDPIGIKNELAITDEYDDYVAKICTFIVERKPLEEMIAYLLWIETEQMGLKGDVERARTVAGSLAQLT